MSDDFSPLTEDVLYCRNNGLLDDELGQATYQIFQAGVCDEAITAMFKRRRSKHKYQQAFHGVIPFKPAKLTKGNYVIGLDQNQNEFRSWIQFLNAHSFTVAGSGAGKTTLARFKILQIALKVKGLWLFDLRKREFALLKSYLARLGEKLIILPGRSLYMNPLQTPPGVDLPAWIPRVADMLIEVLGLPPRASKLLQASLFPLYQKFEKNHEYPTLYDLFEEIKRADDSNYQARIAVLDSLAPVLLSLGPRILAYRRGWSSGELAGIPIVFELAGVSETDKNLLLNSLLLSEFTSRIARGISNPKMDLWICLDEAQRICSRSNQVSALGSQIGLVRGTGIGLDLSVQGMDEVLPQVISNTATKILGRCGSITDYNTAGRSMGLSAEQIQWAQMNLKPGLFIGQLGEGQWRYPFIFQIPPMNFPTVTRSETQADIGSLKNLPVVYAKEFDKWGEIESIPEPADPRESLFAGDQEFRFCQAVVDQPMQPSSSYSSLAKVSPKSVKQIREQLIFKKYIKEHILDSGGRGRSTILLEPLPAGIEAVQQYLGDELCI